MVRESNRRFDELTKKLLKKVKDLFFVESGVSVYAEPYQFSLDPTKLNEFTYWLEQQIETGLLTNWPNKYISDAYKRGLLRSLAEMRKAGYKVPSVAEIGGIELTLLPSPHLNTIELMYLRVLEDLKGITSSMKQIIVRVLSDGFIAGESYATIADKLVAAINGTGAGELGMYDKLGRFIPARRRAEILARTEIVRAHHLAMVQEYRRWGVQGVTVLAEFQTAGDERVCIVCASMEGNVYTLDEAEGLIPVHPQCRCIILPIRIVNR
jgi:SPP1 gp7 family putative phage head morphogenesis protein